MCVGVCLCLYCVCVCVCVCVRARARACKFEEGQSFSSIQMENSDVIIAKFLEYTLLYSMLSSTLYHLLINVSIVYYRILILLVKRRRVYLDKFLHTFPITTKLSSEQTQTQEH